MTLLFGIGLGAMAALLLARGLRRARQRMPQAIAEGARSRFTAIVKMFEEAMDEGRRAMEDKEAELRRGASPAGT